MQNMKIPFYSTKNLEIYNFGDFSKNMNIPPGQYLYVNNNIPNNMGNKNLMMQYPK